MIGQAVVAILDGDQVIGRTLEILLQDARYKSRYVTDFEPDELKEIFTGAGVVILPGDYNGREEGFLGSLTSMATGLGIPVLKLVTVVEEKTEDPIRLVSWPCPIEDLRREIEAALSVGSGFKEAD